MSYTKIYPHPLKDAWCLIVKNSSIPPYIGTLKECKRAQKFAEQKAEMEFGKKK